MALDVPTWGLVLLVVYPLVQIPVVVYLARYVELGEGESAPHPDDGYAFYSVTHGDGGGDGDPEPPPGPAGVGRTCRACGTANDEGFRYCRHCVARLA